MKESIKEKYKNWFGNICIILILIIFIVCIFNYKRIINEHVEFLKGIKNEMVLDSLHQEENIYKAKIDSLEKVIVELDSFINAKEKEIGRIDTVRIIEKENIVNLPIDSGVLLLRENILEYERKNP